MKIRKRGKMDPKVPEVVLKMDEILEICDKHLQSQGIATGKRSCVQVVVEASEVVKHVVKDANQLNVITDAHVYQFPLVGKKDKRKIKAVFQLDLQASTLEETKDDDFRVRLQRERDELLERMEKLKNFMKSEEYKELPQIDRDDLREQLGHMLPYLDVLNRRVARLCFDF